MRLLHYSSKPLGTLMAQEQDEGVRTYGKPRGLWVSVEGEDDWRSWCIVEDYYWHRLTHVHEIRLALDAHVLIVSGEKELDAFHDSFGAADQRDDPEAFLFQGIDWRRVAALYQGIVIAPYVWSRRLSLPVHWYYTWDCASGCIWDPAAISSAKLVEIAPTPVLAVQETQE